MSGSGNPEIVDIALVGIAMQSLNYKFYNSVASIINFNIDGSGNTTSNGDSYAVGFYESSDIRFKNVLETNPEIDLQGIDVIKFTRTDHNEDVVRYGYSAQQIQEILPEAVMGTDKLSVNYMDVHTLKIAALEKRISELETRIKHTL